MNQIPEWLTQAEQQADALSASLTMLYLRLPAVPLRDRVGLLETTISTVQNALRTLRSGQADGTLE